MKVNLTTVLAVLTILGVVLAAGRWVGGIDERIKNLELRDQYHHGDYSDDKGTGK